MIYAKNIPEKQLREFCSQKKTQTEIAEIFGCNWKTVAKRMRYLGIPSLPPKHRWFHGSHNPRWSGSEATYSGFHQRISNTKGRPKKCEICGLDDEARRYEWANMTGDYNNPDDYKRMCIPCQRKHDGNEVFRFSPWTKIKGVTVTTKFRNHSKSRRINNDI